MITVAHVHFYIIYNSLYQTFRYIFFVQVKWGSLFAMDLIDPTFSCTPLKEKLTLSCFHILTLIQKCLEQRSHTIAWPDVTFSQCQLNIKQKEKHKLHVLSDMNVYNCNTGTN